MDPNLPQHFIYVDVSEPRDYGLVEEDRLNSPCFSRKNARKSVGCAGRIEGLKTKVPNDIIGIVTERHSTELTCVVKTDALA